MRRKVIRIAVAALVFVISLFAANILFNRGNTDMTNDMAKATLPIIYMNVNDEYVNPLHGFTSPMEGNYLRGSLTPLMANRSVSFKADLYDAVIAKVAYEVRPLDMSRLIEDTELTNFSYDGDAIFATVTLKDLIEDDTEYMLIIKLTTSSGNVIRYYARVINRAELYISEKIGFVRDFSAKTFNKAEAEELKTYMESNSEGDNSSYGYVNIHSSFNQLTWGNLRPMVITDKDLEILEIDETTASIKLSYEVDIMSEVHTVSEFFRVQRGAKRMYLMEYERKMNQVFDEEKNVVVNGKILHGILNETPSRRENENGTIYTFVQQNALYEYNVNSNTMARLFAFRDKENDDARTRYAAHGIKVLDIDNVGNAKFIVYGYMNRGKHEGEVGVAFYNYDSGLNTIEEHLFIPYNKAYQILEKEVDNLAYVSSRGRFYILLDGAVYSVNLESKQTEVMQDRISETSFFSSMDESMIAWQTGDSVQDYGEIKLYRLDTMSPTSISANNGEIVVPLGFMDSDLIYGVARKEDITTDDTGRTMIPMYLIRIQDKDGNLLKEYRQDGIYVLDISISENMIIMTRMMRDEDTGSLIEIEDDQIMNNKTETTLRNRYSSVVTEEEETTYQTILAKTPSDTSLKLTNPKEVMYEGSRNIVLDNPDNIARYYVYAKGDLNYLYTDAAEAVNDAEESFGVVIDKKMSYIWETQNRKASVRLNNLDIDESQKSSDDNQDDTSEEETDASSISSYAECLDIMLKSRGIYKDTYKEIQKNTVSGVLEKNLDATVLDLSGCDLQAVLYYVSRGYPVMAMTGGGHAVLIIGYDSKNTIIYNPLEKAVYKMGINDSKELFESNGNQYITFVE